MYGVRRQMNLNDRESVLQGMDQGRQRESSLDSRVSLLDSALGSGSMLEYG